MSTYILSPKNKGMSNKEYIPLLSSYLFITSKESCLQISQWPNKGNKFGNNQTSFPNSTLRDLYRQDCRALRRVPTPHAERKSNWWSTGSAARGFLQD